MIRQILHQLDTMKQASQLPWRQLCHELPYASVMRWRQRRQQALLDALLPNLLYPRPLVRKRAVLALGTCAPSQRWRCH